MQSMSEIQKRCNFCGGILLTIKIENTEIKQQLKCKKIVRQCQNCLIAFDDYGIP